MLRQVKSVSGFRLAVFGKELFFCLLSAVLLILSFPNFNIELLAWFGFVPLFFVLKNKSKLKAFFLAYVTGIIFWLGIIYWLIHVTLPGMIILVLYLALYFGFFGLFLAHTAHRTPHTEIFFLPAIWVLLEYARSHLFTGFPWALLGYSQYLNLPIIQIADITGVWGVSFLVMMVNVTLYDAVFGLRFSVCGRRKQYFLSGLCILTVLTYGYYKLYRTPHTAHRTPLKVSVIQANIPQELKWDPAAKDFIMDEYFTLTSQAARDKPDLIIWPEASLPAILEEEPFYYERVKNFTQEIKTPLLFGVVTRQQEVYYNSALFVSGEAEELARYNKLHLVPFGEYIPLRTILPFLETIVPIGDITAGKEYMVFKLPITDYPLPAGRQGLPITFSALICFEDLFPELSRNFVKRGTDFLVNITNDAWYKKTNAAKQHFQASVLRAVENRVFLVRAANTGVSGFISPLGRIISLVQDKKGENIFIRGYATKEITPFCKNLSFYTRYGDIFVLFCFLLILFGVFKFFL